MGQLVDGVWEKDANDTAGAGGRFERKPSVWRNWVTTDGAPGPSGRGGFPAESGRYHLYVSYACPWAHRTLIFRELKGLTQHISVSVVHPDMLSDGWELKSDFPGATGDTLYGLKYLRDIYLKADKAANGHVTVPVLWDKKQETIVSNESAEIIRMFNSAFNSITGNTLDLYPEALRPAIDAINDRVYPTVNNGVYRCGFATSQEAYDEAVHLLFDSLDWLEGLLGKNRYLTGDRITEADWRLFTTLVRFDLVYVTHFKCNRNTIRELPNLWGWVRELYQTPGIAATVNFAHIVHHYYYSHPKINPNRIVPINPVINWNEPHNRGQ